MICADNARPHTAHLSVQFFKQNWMKTVLHPPYSPDLAPSDFYLLGKMKGCLLHTIQRVLAGIKQLTLEAVFLEWTNRARKCIDTNAEHVD
jgi:histone-lysine N-methyltransferase SETMAR